MNEINGQMKTNECAFDLNQVFYLNNANMDSVCIYNTNDHHNNNNYKEKYNEEHLQSYNDNNLAEQNSELFWITSTNTPTTSNNYFEFPYVQISNTTDNNMQVQEGLQFLNILHQGEYLDQPEFIDINDLKISDTFLKENDTCKRINENDIDEDDDDDVIFVKEYYLNSKNKQNNDSKEINNDTKKKPVLPEPRRNPKRQVQLQKASLELAMKLSQRDAINNVRTRRNTNNKLQPVVSIVGI